VAKESSLTNNLYKFVVAVLFVFLVVLRFWKSAEWFSFNFDEEYQALLAWSQVKDFHPIWIGVSASNFGFYLGPAFTYLNALLFWLGKGDLSVLAYFSSLFGIMTTVSLYFVASRIFSKKVGLVASVLYGFSALLIYFDHRFWNPTPIPFITVWLLYSLYKSEKDSRWFILSTLLMASALHIHLSLMVYWPLVIFFVLRNIKKISLSTWIISIFFYLAVVSPLIVFDINHNFDDLLGPVRYLMSPKTSGSVFGMDQLSYHLHNIWFSVSRLLYLKPFTNIQEEHGLGAHADMTQPVFLVSLFVISGLLWFLKKSMTEKRLHILAWMIISIFLFYIIYPSIGCEYYLLGFFIMTTIVLGLFLEKVDWKILTPLFAIYIAINSFTIFTTTQSQYGLATRRNLINQVMLKIGDSPFSLETVGEDPRPYHPYGGWRYLFQTYGNKPNSSFADEYFGWIYQDEMTNERSVYRVVVSERLPYEYANSPALIATSGAFTGYVFKLD
jgi:4-amino-4-deoxy-L-arabinose transferase-like glycosyltransferase